ncbi:MAG: hypothetical protein PW786_12930 [Arachidicoccus sp.]|nr:hypothetical protein [Arachidicoccus sp.]
MPLFLLIELGCSNKNRGQAVLPKNSNIIDTIKTFYDSGRTSIASLTPLENGKKNGLYVAFYPNGDTASLVIYKNDKIIDSVINFYHNKNFSSILYYDSLGNLLHLAKIFYDNGELKQYVSADGEEMNFFYRDGALQLKSHYHNNKKNGKWIYYAPDSTILKIEKYKNDSLIDFPLIGDTSVRVHMNGWLRIYNDDNTALISESYYKKGMKDGTSIDYYEDGNIKKISFYKNGILNGKQILLSNDGQVESQIFYKNGNPN